MIDAAARGLAAKALAQTPKIKARRFIDLATRGGLPGVMATPPTVTVGTTAANSTVITGATQFVPTVLPSDTRITPMSCPAVTAISNGYYCPVYITETNAQRTNGWGVAFYTDAEAFDILFRDFNSRFRIKVDGLWTQTADYAPFGSGTGANNTYVKVDFGSTAIRKVEIYFGGGFTIRGFNFGPSAGAATASAQPYRAWAAGDLASLPRIIMPGTSYEYGVGPTNTRDSLTFIIGELLANPGIISMGVGGQGYVGLSTNSAINLTQHLQDFATANVGVADMVIIGGLGINDQGQTPATVQANATTAIASIMASQPDAIIPVFGPWRAPGKAPAQNIADAVKAAFTAVADLKRMFYVDTYAAPTYQDTSGGNSALYIGGDTVHPNTVGDVYLGRRAAADILTGLRVLAA